MASLLVHLFGWRATLPLRPLPPLLDPLLTRLLGFPPFCIGLEAYKPPLPAARTQAQRAAAEQVRS